MYDRMVRFRSPQVWERLLILLSLVLALGGSHVAVARLAAAGSAVTAKTLSEKSWGRLSSLPGQTGKSAPHSSFQTSSKTLDRDSEPVIITGTAVSALLRFPTDELFVYAYRGGVWEQIPAQVDEVTATGAYTTTEDGLLDANDEVVFMAMDLGDQAVGMVPTANGQPIGALWYEIEVTDPISPTLRSRSGQAQDSWGSSSTAAPTALRSRSGQAQDSWGSSSTAAPTALSAAKGWAYLVHSSVLTPTFTADYVSFDPIKLRINGLNYHLGFAQSRPWLEYLSLGDSEVDILDRTPKLRCCWGENCWYTEDNVGDVKDDLIRDGPVRAIMRSGRARAYGTMATWTIPVPIILFTNRIRFSTDFNSAATGAMFYNAVVPDGVTVNGLPDHVPTTPPSSWTQLSTSMGTIIQVADNSPIGGKQTNYYVDDATADTTDTGDKQHYADAGISATNPNRSFTYTFTFYFLSGSQPNIGKTYEAYFMQPLSIVSSRKELSVRLEAAPENLTVDESSTLTATVEYAGVPISGTTVAFTIVSGQGVVTPTLGTTDAAGKATTSLSSQVAGGVVVKAVADPVNSNAKTVTFTPGAVTTVTLEAAPDRLIAGQSSTLKATAVDQYSNPISGTDVTFTIVSGSGEITPATARTNEAGQATASLSSQMTGNVAVKATADSVESNHQTVTFLEGVYVYLPAVIKIATR